MSKINRRRRRTPVSSVLDRRLGVERLESRRLLATFYAELVANSLDHRDPIAVAFSTDAEPSSIGDPSIYRLIGPEGPVSVDAVEYSVEDRRATLTVNGEAELPLGTYELLVHADGPTGSAGESYRGAIDAAVGLTNGLSAKLPILRGVEGGRFAISNSLDAPRNLEHLAAGDFNGDGATDFLAAKMGSDSGFLFLSEPEGGYAAPSNRVFGDTITDLAVADFNGDGLDDFVVVNLFQSFEVHLNDGAGGFHSTEYSTPDRAKSAAAADLDGDGTIDLAIAVENSGVVLHYNPTGDGDFGDPSDRLTIAMPAAGRILAHDFDLDGRVDLASADPVARSAYIAFNQPNRSFQIVQAPTPGVSVNRLAAGDFNGDGTQDLALLSSAPKRATLYFNGSDGRTFTLAQSLSLDDNDPTGVAVGDLNFDGYDDLLVSTDNTSDRDVLSRFLGGPDGLGERQFVGVGTFGSANDLVIGEFDPWTTIGRFETVEAPESEDELLVGFELRLVDADGRTIDRVVEGSTFYAALLAQDLRDDPAGVFSAFVDLRYPTEHLSIAGPIEFGPAFPNVRSAGLSEAGLVNELGGAGGFGSTGAGKRLVAKVPLRAEAIGLATLATEAADVTPGHDVLVYGEDDPVPAGRIVFGHAAIEIVAAVEASDDEFDVEEDAVDAVLTPLDNDLAPSFATLAIVGVGAPDRGGRAVISDDGRSLLYSPRPDFFGVETLTYLATDGAGRFDEATVVVRVAPVNDPPIAIDDMVFDVSEDSDERSIDVLANDDVGAEFGDELTIVAVSAGSRGGSTTVSNDGLRILYRPAPDMFGVETLTYRIRDGEGAEAEATVAVQVSSVNDAPTAADDLYRVLRDSAPAAFFVLANDSAEPDVGETLSIVSTGPSAAGGSTAVAADGRSVVYQPSAGFVGIDSFVYSVSDGNGGTSSSTVTVEVRKGWQNAPDRLDVNNDGFVSPLDALVVINELHRNGSRALAGFDVADSDPRFFFDVNGDHYVSPIDALLVINFLNANSEAVEGEGEGDESREDGFGGSGAGLAAVRAVDAALAVEDWTDANSEPDEAWERLLESLSRDSLDAR